MPWILPQANAGPQCRSPSREKLQEITNAEIPAVAGDRHGIHGIQGIDWR